MRVVQEEVFGAVACILEFDNEDEVIRRANNTDFGLAGGLFTKYVDFYQWCAFCRLETSSHLV